MRVQVGTIVSGAGVLGAAAWIARWATDLDPLLWVGAALLSVVAVAAGAGMVKPVPLRVVVGVCLALLCWSLGAVAGLDGDPVRAGIAGLVLLVVVPVAWERVRPVGPKRVRPAAAPAPVVDGTDAPAGPGVPARDARPGKPARAKRIAEKRAPEKRPGSHAR